MTHPHKDYETLVKQYSAISMQLTCKEKLIQWQDKRIKELELELKTCNNGVIDDLKNLVEKLTNELEGEFNEDD